MLYASFSLARLTTIMDTALLITTTVTVSLAFVGYVMTYMNTLRLAQRAERLARVNRQLGEFYGPMLAMSHATHQAWDAFRLKYRPGVGSFWNPKNPPTEEEAKVYRIWMSTVFIPINVRAYELILSKADLLIESQMHESLLQFCVHVASYQAMLKRWESNDFTENKSLVRHPREQLEAYLRDSFRALKKEQAELLAKGKPRKKRTVRHLGWIGRKWRKPRRANGSIRGPKGQPGM
jgi:hypothetical protein